MKSNGDRFEEAYNRIDRLLRERARLSRDVGFSTVVNEAAKSDPAVRRFKNDLLEFGDLRNAIVHDRGTSPKVIADPRDDVVRQLEEIWLRLSQPRRLRSLKPSIPLRFFDVDCGLPHALAYMRENDFSQVIVFREGRYVILSCEGVVHWLESKATEDVIALSEVRLEDVAVREPKDTCVYLKADDTIEHAQEVFTKDIGKRVFSALVTESGRPTEKPITIVTPWDFVVGNLR